jgi:hypothetical protein
MRYEEQLRKALGLDEPERWTWWDRLVHRVTGRVSSRVYERRMTQLWLDDMERRRREFEADVRRMKASYGG